MSKELVSTVHVHREDGSTVVYAPGDEVPAADAKLIVNAKAWTSAKSEK